MLRRERGSKAITLRNKRVEEQIREIGRWTGEGPSAVIARVVEAECARLKAERDREAQERLAAIRAFTATLPSFTEEERRAAREDLRTMHDDLDQDGGE